MSASIISVGRELVTGQSVDTNSACLARRLTELGVCVAHHQTVDDDEQAIARAVRQALPSAKLVIVTGGIGPTPDDLTRYGIALAIDKQLEESPEALAQIEAFFAQAHRSFSPPNRVQALIPQGCRVIPNAIGTAPGFSWRNAETELFVLPGVPDEMEAMFEAAICPSANRIGGGACSTEAVVRCVGVSEARLGDGLREMMRKDRNPRIGTTAHEGIIGIRIHARAATIDLATALIKSETEKIRQKFKSAVLEGQSLEADVASLLIDKGLTLATAESCTGGLLAKRLTDIPGSSRFFLRGYVSYSNEAKADDLKVRQESIDVHGAVSEEVAHAMSSGCRTRAGSDFALSVTGIAGPEGSGDKPVGLVFVGLASPEGIRVKRLTLGAHLGRSGIRDRSCKAALNWLRLTLLGVTDR